MRIALVVALAAFAGGAAAQLREPCMETYNAEIVAIERDAKARQNVGTDAAKQRAASDARARLEAAARRAKQCQDAARAPADPAKGAAKAAATAADDCKDKTSAHAAEIERRFGSETLDQGQQNLRREEESRLQAELNECRRRRR